MFPFSFVEEFVPFEYAPIELSPSAVIVLPFILYVPKFTSPAFLLPPVTSILEVTPEYPVNPVSIYIPRFPVPPETVIVLLLVGLLPAILLIIPAFELPPAISIVLSLVTFAVAPLANIPILLLPFSILIFPEFTPV